MSRYIDANDFENVMYHEAFETDTEMQRWDSGCWIRYKLFENLLEKQPTADVVEVVHGEWIDSTDETFSPSHKCSRCGHIINELATDDINATDIERENYCPNCGAKMDGEHGKKN